MARSVLRGPHLLHRVRRVVLGPHVGDVETVLDHALRDVLGEQLVHRRLVARQRAHRQDRIAERLELLEHRVVEARIVVVRAAEHHERDAVLARHLVEDLATLALHLVLERLDGLERLVDREVVLVLGEAEQRAPLVEHLLLAHQRLVQRHRRVEVADAALGEEVGLLRERRADDLRRARRRPGSSPCPSGSR